MNARRSFALAASALALTGGLTVGGVADAATVAAPPSPSTATARPDGYASSSRIQRGRCTGWVTTKTISGHRSAQGVLLSNNAHCQMYLGRKHGSGSYTPVSNSYLSQAGDDETWRTGFHRDDKGYKARVCISNLDWNDQKFYCGTGV